MASSKKSIVAAVIADAAIAALKFAGGAVTGSAVMIAEGIHSVVDGGNTSLLLYAQRRAGRPADETHPFGHGKEIYFWTTIVATLAFVIGGGFAVIEGVLALHEQQSQHWWLNYVVLAGAFVFESSALFVSVRELRKYREQKGYVGGLFRVMRQSHNPPIFITVLVDLAALVGLVIAAVGVGLTHALDAPVVDTVATLLDGALLMAMGAFLVWEAHGLVVGESARTPLLDAAERLIRSDEHVAALDDMHSLQLGADDVLLMLHARFRAGMRVEELEQVTRALEARLRAQHPEIKHVVFDFDQASLAPTSRS